VLKNTLAGTELPLLPLCTTVPALGVLEVTCDVPTGLTVLHVIVTVQLLAPAAITQDVDERFSVPESGARQILPFHVVPVAQLAVAVLLTNSVWLLYR